MAKIFRDLPFVTWYLDNVLVHLADMRLHGKHLKEVFHWPWAILVCQRYNTEAIPSQPVFTILLLILPTKFLCTSSAWHRMPTDPSHTRCHEEISEPLTSQRWWHPDSYSVRGTRSFFSQCTSIPQCRYFVTGTYIYMCLVSRSQAHSQAQRNIFLRRTYAAPCSKIQNS